MNEINLGDVIETRKPHPCGGKVWDVIRTGADIKIKCRQCGHIVMLDREAYLKRCKRILEKGPGASGKENSVTETENYQEDAQPL